MVRENKVKAIVSSFSSMRVSELLLLLVLNCLAFQMVFQDAFGGFFAFFDEIATLSLVFIALVVVVRNHKSMPDAWACLVSLFCFVIVGLMSTYMSGIQTKPFPVLVDLFTCVKFILAGVSVLVVLNGRELSSHFQIVVMAEAKLLVLLCATLALANVFFDFGMRGGEDRFGMEAYVFLFTQPEYVNLFILGIAVLLCWDFRANYVWIALCAIPMLLTLRTKAIGFVLFAIFVALYVSRAKRLRVWPFLLIGLVVLGFASGQIANYYQNDFQARSALTKYSFEIAEQSFPFGSGFATFGSAITARPDYYSPLYDTFGFSEVYGLSRSYSAFMSDTCWPILLGQFGWFGLLVFALALILLVRAYYGASKERLQAGDKGPLIALLFMFGYLLISSLASSAFFAPMSIYLLICLAIVVSRPLVDGSGDRSRSRSEVD